MGTMKKTCTACKRQLTDPQFYPHESGKNKLRSQCIVCFLEKKRRAYAKRRKEKK